MAKRSKQRVPGRTAKRAPQPTPLLTRNRIIVAVGIAAALAVVLVVASVLSARGDGDDGGGSTTAIAGSADVEAMLEGIPQDGVVLGEPDAPVTLVEYADLQCPFCAQWARETLPELVADYVREGQLRIEFRGLTFIGPESEDALRAALGAGEQGKFWNVADLVYVNQGAENSGWVTEDFLRSVGEAVPGRDVEQMLADGDSEDATAAIDEAADAAAAAGVEGTPAFEIGETGGELNRLEITSLGPEEFRAAIDKLLGG
jgi:protein-disulfide isomerase